MPVFDTSNRIPRRVKDPRTDKSLPPSGALNWRSITSDSALSGTTGHDCMAVHGDRWQQMTGSLVENYSANKTITVRGKHTETITGNRSITVTSGNVTHNVSAGGVTDHIARNHEETAGGNYHLQAGQSIEEQAAMNCKIQAGQNIEETAGMQHKVQGMMIEHSAGAMATHKAGGIMTVQGTLVKINC